VDNGYFNAYFAEYRIYSGYDASLKTGPYNFGFPPPAELVEHLPVPRTAC
jgi:immune inhibitor A